jgi:hypothetical protein
MIEVSTTEIALFCWAVLATGYALRYKSEARGADVFIKVLLENKEVRDDVVAKFEQFRKGQQS